MDDFKVIYRILKAIYDAMDYDEFDFNTISPEALRVTPQKRDALLVMLLNRGLIDGAKLIPVAGGSVQVKFLGKPCLTLDGLEYLEENSLMQKAAKAVKGIMYIIV